MKYRNILFSTLKEIEKKKIAKESITIKNLYIKKKQNDAQLKLLFNYEKEYIKKINNKMILGVCVHEWENYKIFILQLQTIIQDNIKTISRNQTILEESLIKWSQNQIKSKVWHYLNKKNKKNRLKIKKIQEQTLHDNCAQLKILKKGQSL